MNETPAEGAFLSHASPVHLAGITPASSLLPLCVFASCPVMLWAAQCWRQLVSGGRYEFHILVQSLMTACALTDNSTW